MAEPYRQTRHGIKGWEVRVQVRGKRSRLWAPTKNKLDDLIEDLEDKSQRQRRGYRQPKELLTYDELCERVLKLYPHRESSKTSLQHTLRYSRDWFGDYGLYDFDAESVEEWLLSLRTAPGRLKPLSAYTRRAALKAMRYALGWAVAKGYLDVNCASMVDSPEVVDIPDPFDSWEQVFKVARAFDYKPYGQAVRFAAGQGLRPQEWVVLRERDLDRRAGTLTINRTWGGPKAGEVALAKNESSQATVYLSDIALEVLDELPRSLDRDALLFPAPHGGLISFDNWRRDAWAKALAKAGVRYRPPKALRHTMATLALKADVPIEDVSRMLRHSSVKVTEKHYIRVVPSVKRRSAERLSADMPRFDSGVKAAGG